MRRGRVLLFAMLVGAGPVRGQDPVPEAPAPGANDSITATSFMVASAHPLATQAGYAILEAGGSAADAAVAVQMMLGLVEPQYSGLGGGAFLLYWNAALGELATFDGRETAPAAADPSYFLNEDGTPMEFWEAVVGGRSAGVPGTPKLMEEVHARYGRLPWADLFEDAIETAEAGFDISPRLAAAIAEAAEQELGAFPEARAYFLTAAGEPKPEKEVLANPAYARTLRLLAAEGSAPFYTGAIARDIVAAVRTETNPGMLTLEDLASYEVKERPPVCMDYREFEVCGMGPPSSGALTVGQILGILSHWPLGEPGLNADPTHLFVEASKLAFADRGLYMADSDFVEMPTEGLLDPDYLATRAELIDPGAAIEEAAPGEPPWDQGLLYAPAPPQPEFGTSHFVIVDRYGDMVSATTTIETGFGSRVMTNGFLLNNELTDFSFEPEEDGKPVANRVEGGKPPRSSMAPTIVFEDGEPRLLIGSPGGSRIINYVAGALVGILDLGLDPQEAIDRPHVVNRNSPVTEVEDGPEAQAAIDALAAIGHAAEPADLNSGLHAILIGEDGTLTGAADKRREGLVMGE